MSRLHIPPSKLLPEERVSPLMDLDEDVKNKTHILEELAFNLLEEADLAILEADEVKDELEGAVLKFRGAPQQIVFDFKLEANDLISQMEIGFKNQAFDSQQLEYQVGLLVAHRDSERQLIKVLDQKTEGLKNRIGYKMKKISTVPAQVHATK